MGFERGDPWTLVTILLHAFLSVCALIPPWTLNPKP